MAGTKYQKQSVDFLGFLRGQLNGLSGISTLCYELIQNADDVKDENKKPGASRITFDVCDDALLVENDGVFREIDFERLQRLSWGNKRAEADTTGAFGIGFISVYQITDAPELFSSKRHWVFQPTAPEDERIREEVDDSTPATLFRLPWAFEMSATRKELGLPPVEQAQIDQFVEKIREAIENAALFLKQIRVLELKRSGKSISRVETLREANQIVMQINDRCIRWVILEGSFSADAKKMRERFGDIIEGKRRDIVQVAIPEQPLENGLLYAFLPSETRTLLPFHINADFYPTPDRKRILFERDYKSEWNELAVRCAARTLAGFADGLLGLFTPKDFWKFAQDVKNASEQNSLSRVFAEFWAELKPQIRSHKTVKTISEHLRLPTETFFLDTEAHAEAGPIFDKLGLPIVHPELRAYRNLLLETGVRLPKIDDVFSIFKKNKLLERTELSTMPEELHSDENRRSFEEALNDLYDQTPQNERLKAQELLSQCAIAMGSDGAFWPPSSNKIFATDDQVTRQLFERFKSIVWLEDMGCPDIPFCLVPEFELKTGLEALETNLSLIEQQWKKKQFPVKELYEWLEGRKSEITDGVRERLRNCPIWPAADGTLQPLNNLYLLADFKDPLKLARLIDVAALGGKAEFLERHLGVKRLGFVTYVRDFLPSALANGQLTTEQQKQLLIVLAENLGKLHGREDLRQLLSGLNLVWCGNDRFLPAKQVYFDTEIVRVLFGKEYLVARFPDGAQETVKPLYEWLGVLTKPLPEHLLRRIQEIVTKPPDDQGRAAIQKIFEYIAVNWDNWEDFKELQTLAWLPGSKERSQWHSPSEVYTTFRNYLFESQGNFLDIDRQIQQQANDFAKFLGIRSNPSIDQVVSHLLYIVKDRKVVKFYENILKFLNDEGADEHEIERLKDEPCLLLKLSSGEERFVRPNQVFWEEHPFGKYRYRLGHEFGSYKDLFDKLGVKDLPNYQDAKAVLLEIANEFGRSNIPLDDATMKIVWMCWKILGEDLEKGSVSRDEIHDYFHGGKTIPDARCILAPPETLFFEDRSGWGEKFPMIKNNLIKYAEGTLSSMEAAGLRRLSTVVRTELHQCDGKADEQEIPKRIGERMALFQRVVEAHRAKVVGQFNLHGLQRLKFVRADRIEVRREFYGYMNRPQTICEPTQAVLVDGTLYFCLCNGDYPWTEIASELALVLYPSLLLSSLALELKEILASSSDHEARMTLDLLGYPPAPEQLDYSQVSGTAPAGIGGETFAEPIEVENYPPDVVLESSTSQVTGRNTKPLKELDYGVAVPNSSTTWSDKRNTTRLVSYVYPEESQGVFSPLEQKTKEGRDQISQLGIEKVMMFEKQHGRNPTDMESIQPNHPGYDIESIDGSGKIRYIEVKALSRKWDSSNPAQMTKNEFETARKLGDEYWLYIVEYAGTESACIYQIQNPAGKANYYLFDHGWQHTASQTNLHSP